MVSLASIPGIGKARLNALGQEGIRTVEELLLHYPCGYRDTTRSVPFSGLEPGNEACVEGLVDRVSGIRAFGGRTMVTLTVAEAETGKKLPVVFFNQPWTAKQFSGGQEVCFFGRVSTDRRGRISMVCPVTVHKRGIEPIYRPVAGISGGVLRGLMAGAVEHLEECCPETLPASLRLSKGLCERNFALRQAHFPESAEALDIALRRIGFEAALMYCVALQLTRGERRSGIRIDVTDRERETFAGSLPYELTGAQKRVLREIEEDLRSPMAMSRLVQGDVGCGKTALAFAAMYYTACHGYQAALMAPTEILARQHYETASGQLGGLGLKCGLLVGGMREAERAGALEHIRSGEWQCVIGTHALLGEQVAFSRLGLVITDEQHRFGVKQRRILTRSGEGEESCNTMVMSATPIPRTLSLILYGDLDLSAVDEMPPGRKKVRTHIVPEAKREEMYGFLLREAAAGRQAYIVCPFVEENETMDVRSAQEEYAYLCRGPLRTLRLGLTWGGQKEEEKNETMRRFAAGELDVLVSTTVIEVGVNVPNASVMVIENAERFGLATLHQLRGRVGRGTGEAWCFLMGSETERMKLLCSTNDGFRISQADLDLRGPGEFLGTRQHGWPAGMELLRDAKLLEEVRRALEELRRDPDPGDWETVRAQAARQYAHALESVAMN